MKNSIIKKVLSMKDVELNNTNTTELNHILKTEQGELFISDFVSIIDSGKDIDNEVKDVLKVLVKVANYIYTYSNEESFISDSDYDKLFEYYQTITDDTSFTIGDSTNKVPHKYLTLRGTLNKIYKITDEDVIKNDSQKSIDDWIKQTERVYRNNKGHDIDLLEEDIIVMPKFDGVSAIFEFKEGGILDRVLTRGDTERNLAVDITHILKNTYKPEWANMIKFDFGVKTEIMMSEADLDKYNETYHTNYKNTRSIVSSIINSKEPDDRVKYLKVIPLRYTYIGLDKHDVLQDICPDSLEYPVLECKLKDFDKIREFAYNNKYVYNKYRCDGAVIIFKDKLLRYALGRENNKQLSEVAYKFTEETGYSEVIDIEFSMGTFGTLTPVVNFKPIKLKGNTVENASLGSYARFNDLELCKGDIIKVIYDIIPYVVFDKDDPRCKRSGKKPIVAPVICNECGEQLFNNGTIIKCTNKKCPSVIKGRILNFCKKMNIKNISYGIITSLYNEGILTDIKSLFSLGDKKDIIIKLDGFGDLKVDNFVEEINKIGDISASTVLGAIGIEGVSTKTFKSVLSYIYLDELLDICKNGNIEVLTVVPGVKTKTATKIIDGVVEMYSDIKFLMNNLNIIDEPKNKAHFSVVFTKFRDEELEKFIIDNGGEVCDSLTKKINILVVPNKYISSSKIDKAKKYGIEIVSKDELKDYIKKEYM